ncbi:hypothetical protein LK09_03840 [Microbacterium mangrovi]|uniref:PNPLA domain-containing protein n=1 Tax=Microbacterium mangrovi TaxID=1348253 RepID=A0A0B2ABZ2_9MICO|nr:patatin-like phospholipase family protein [Microbacterium mangrovi]KHK99151.1 hypothetical protein LK09_03840 [Microbacterium mangrovi]
MENALVLGSGGITGIAWTLGVLSTWARGPFDVVLGSSAGAFAGALLEAPEAFAQACERVSHPDSSSARRDLALALGGAAPRLLSAPGPLGDPLARAWIVGTVTRRFAASAGSGPRALGAGARAIRKQLAIRPLDDVDVRALAMLAAGRRRAAGPGWVAYWQAQLGDAEWPGELQIVAIDSRTGARHVFDRDAGVPLARAVAASTAIPALVGAMPIGDSAYFDAGILDTTSADLVAGADAVTVIAPYPRPPIDTRVAELRAGGTEVTLLTPSDLAVLGLGQQRLDAAGQRASFELGLRDGRMLPAG